MPPEEVEKTPRAGRSKLGELMHRLFFRSEHEREQMLIEALQDLDQARDATELASRALLACEQAIEPQTAYLFGRRQEQLRLFASLAKMDGKVLFGPSEALCAVAAGWREAREISALPLPAEERQALRRFSAKWAFGGVDAHDGRLGVLLLLGEGAAELGAVQRDLVQALVDRTAQVLRRCHQAWLATRRAEQRQSGWLMECPECGQCFDSSAFLCPADDSELEPTLLLDRRLGGRYLLERRLGRGASSAVYASRDQQSGAKVAIKILASGDALALGRFFNEAKAGRLLTHPNLVQVLDSGTLSRQSAYLVMEQLYGLTLRQILDESRKLEPKRVARIFDQFLAGLAFAHQHGIVHRDLKPENIMVVEPGSDQEQVKILDFGLAKLTRSDSGPQVALTMAGMVIGTLSYMSPEQLAGEPVDHHADLFATGVMIAEALKGKLPFRGENLGQMLRAVAIQPFELEARTPAQQKVAAILGKALEKKPDHRIESAEALRVELIPALAACEPFD